MTEERRLMAAGLHLEDAISICHDLRRERDELSKFIRRKETERKKRKNHYERLFPL